MSPTSRLRRLRALAVATLIATFGATAGLVSAGATPARAASFYEDHSPQTWWTGNGGERYRCQDDAFTVREAYWPGGGSLAVELRYSPRCRTAWARGTAAMYIQVNGFYQNGTRRAYRYAGADPTAPDTAMHWTVMLDDSAPLLANACIGYWGTGGWIEYCTGKF